MYNRYIHTYIYVFIFTNIYMYVYTHTDIADLHDNPLNQVTEQIDAHVADIVRSKVPWRSLGF